MELSLDSEGSTLDKVQAVKYNCPKTLGKSYLFGMLPKI